MVVSKGGSSCPGRSSGSSLRNGESFHLNTLVPCPILILLLYRAFSGPRATVRLSRGKRSGTDAARRASPTAAVVAASVIYSLPRSLKRSTPVLMVIFGAGLTRTTLLGETCHLRRTGGLQATLNPTWRPRGRMTSSNDAISYDPDSSSNRGGGPVAGPARGYPETPLSSASSRNCEPQRPSIRSAMFTHAILYYLRRIIWRCTRRVSLPSRMGDELAPCFDASGNSGALDT